MTNNTKKIRLKYKGRIRQVPIYLGKLFRMFIYMDDWKVLPMAAIIAGLVSLVAGANMFKTMEGTAMGALALCCVCIWNGFFNSIQVICREREIVKREHRSGMHISSYIMAHVVYQAILCTAQTVITISICSLTGMIFPVSGLIFGNFKIDLGITLFLITFSADMLSLMISCIAKNTTSAMTIMPFTLIFELLFSGSMFGLGGSLAKLTDLSLAKWGINAICAQSNYNSLPMVSVWNQIFKFRNMDIMGSQPIKLFTDYIEQNDMIDSFCLSVGQNSTNAEYIFTHGNILNCWAVLIVYSILFAVLAVIFLERIDQDKR